MVGRNVYLEFLLLGNERLLKVLMFCDEGFHTVQGVSNVLHCQERLQQDTTITCKYCVLATYICVCVCVCVWLMNKLMQ